MVLILNLVKSILRDSIVYLNKLILFNTEYNIINLADNFIPNNFHFFEASGTENLQIINLFANADTYFTNFLQIEILGHNLYTNGAILLIILSFILLLAMFAIIIISSKNN